jgi:hypothetical protein
MLRTLKVEVLLDERNKLIFGPHAGFGVTAMKEYVGYVVVAETVSMITAEKADNESKSTKAITHFGLLMLLCFLFKFFCMFKSILSSL